MRAKRIRLGCLDCDTEEGDGITIRQAQVTGWTEIAESNLLPDERDSLVIWFTHSGLCPSCSHPPAEAPPDASFQQPSLFD